MLSTKDLLTLTFYPSFDILLDNATDSLTHSLYSDKIIFRYPLFLTPGHDALLAPAAFLMYCYNYFLPLMCSWQLLNIIRINKENTAYFPRAHHNLRILFLYLQNISLSESYGWRVLSESEGPVSEEEWCLWSVSWWLSQSSHTSIPGDV